MRCYYVTRNEDGTVSQSVANRAENESAEGDTVINVEWSAVNYKDALAATGHPGVARSLPHVPGIDGVGVVERSADPNLSRGASVVVAGYGLGSERWGAWSERIRVPANWVIPLPHGLTSREAITLGTAGITAGMSIESLRDHGIVPSSGPVLVTGATGGVGLLALRILAQLGYEVVAVSGKAEFRPMLLDWGASRVLDRTEIVNSSTRPLLSSRWAGAIDCVGGSTLATILRELRSGGCVAACGLVGGADLNTSVYPFILRGITLVGIDSATYPRDRRRRLWSRLANEWKPDILPQIVTVTDLDHVGESVSRILAGQVFGRVIVRVN